MLQVGVAIFAFDPTTRRWTCRPFNFWTIPDAKVGKGVFASQASSLQFLVECGFDLNKCVGKGIPFVPASERSKTEQRRAQLAQRPPIIPSSDRDIAFVRDLLIKVTDWLTRSDNDEEDYVFEFRFHSAPVEQSPRRSLETLETVFADARDAARPPSARTLLLAAFSRSPGL